MSTSIALDFAASPWIMATGHRVQVPEDGESYKSIPGSKKGRKKYAKPKMRKGGQICGLCKRWIDSKPVYLISRGRSPYTNEWIEVRVPYHLHCSQGLARRNPHLKFVKESEG